MKVVFSTSFVHARDRVDYWREEASKVLVAHQFSTPIGHAFEGVIEAGALGSLAASIFDCNECSGARTLDCLRRGYIDELLLSVQLEGSLALYQDGRDAVVETGDVLLVDPRRPFHVNVPKHTRSFVVKVPRSEMRARLGEVTMLTAQPIKPEGPVGALASNFFSMLAPRTAELDEPMGNKVAQQAFDLVALAFESEVMDRRAKLSSARATTLLRLKAIIEARLCDPELKPAVAASAAGISVRYANALLAQEDTSLERFIMFRRLQHCYQALSDPTQSLRTVSDIAYSYGFSDVSHFARRFKAEFGCSPSECRPQGAAAAGKYAMASPARRNGMRVAGAGR
jgi:AraC-like DNA-binding protein